MRETNPWRIAERLGVSADTVLRVQAHGYLGSLELTDAEIRLRLWRGHAAARAHSPAAIEPICQADGSSNPEKRRPSAELQTTALVSIQAVSAPCLEDEDL
jgi:hypothetical protein